ncbi:MAG: hypothetical protein KAI22_05790, partial [Gammaproteobacteria bacterium]|nr:hypothetical protein [Gammaproteobacteria bacterium]
MSVDNITLQKLQKITYQVTAPLQLNFEEQIIQCNELIRVVPGKRIVFLGAFSSKKEFNKKVIIKTFVHSSRARKHWLREQAGSELLSDNQILTPELMSQGLSDEGVYFLIFRYIEGQNLAEFWAENNQFERDRKLKDLMPVLAQHHRAGLAHQDLHYGNFFLAKEDAVYTLDGEEVKASSAPLKKKTRLKNLALFLAQTFDLTQTSSLSLLNDYISLASLSLKKQEPAQFLQWIKDYRQARINQYLKKILRECTEVVYQQKYEKKKSSYSLCRREYHNQAIQQLLDDPEHFFQNEDSFFLKQGNTCTVKSVLLDNERYVIKRYNPKGIAYELKHKGQISRARKSWINAHFLRFMGILTPEPVALIEQSPALGKRCSYFICQYQQGQSSWDFFCDERFCDEGNLDKQELDKDKQLAADELIATLRRLCEYHITHGDLKGSNFLIHKNKVWILDLDAMTQHKMNWRF